ncbi:hypothetical protein RDABS01_035826 [Bienertia sinuspersici]
MLLLLPFGKIKMTLLLSLIALLLLLILCTMLHLKLKERLRLSTFQNSSSQMGFYTNFGLSNLKIFLFVFPQSRIPNPWYHHFLES